MDSSRGFASKGCDNALCRLAFTTAPAGTALTEPHPLTRRIILQKARCQALAEATSPPTAWKHTISGSISLPSPGCFSPFPHGTVRYRSLRVACLGLWSAQLQTGFFVPGPTQEKHSGRWWTATRLSRAMVRLSRPLRLSREDRLSVARHSCASYNPTPATAGALAQEWFRQYPVRSPLLRV
jgi:hypothetical protein